MFEQFIKIKGLNGDQEFGEGLTETNPEKTNKELDKDFFLTDKELKEKNLPNGYIVPKRFLTTSEIMGENESVVEGGLKREEVRPEMLGVYDQINQMENKDGLEALRLTRNAALKDLSVEEQEFAPKNLQLDKYTVNKNILDEMREQYPTTIAFFGDEEIANIFREKPKVLEKMNSWRVPFAKINHDLKMERTSSNLNLAKYDLRTNGNKSPENLEKIEHLEKQMADLIEFDETIKYNHQGGGKFKRGATTTFGSAGSILQSLGMTGAYASGEAWKPIKKTGKDTFSLFAPPTIYQEHEPRTLVEAFLRVPENTLKGIPKYSYIQANESVYEDAVARGVDPSLAAKAGVVAGGITAVLEVGGMFLGGGGGKAAKALGVNKLINKLAANAVVAKAVAKASEKSLSGAITRGVLDVGVRAGGETATEVIQEIAEVGASDIAGRVSNKKHGTDIKPYEFGDYLDVVGETMWKVGPGMLFLGGIGGGLTFKKDMREVKTAKFLKKVMEAEEKTIELVSVAEQITKDVIENPEIAEVKGLAGKIIEEQLGGEENQVLFAQAKDIEVFFQEEFENNNITEESFETDFLENLHIDKEKFLEALTDDGAIEIPVTAIPSIAKNPIWQKILQKKEGLTTIPRHEINEALQAVNDALPEIVTENEHKHIAIKDINKKAKEFNTASAGRFGRAYSTGIAKIVALNAGMRASVTGENATALLNKVSFQNKAYQAEENSGINLKKKGRGQIAFLDDGQAVISVFERANESTAIHELGHYFLKSLEELTNLDVANILNVEKFEQAKQDLQTVYDWLGAKKGTKLNLKQNEKFARGFETYLFEGKAPIQTLFSFFERMKDWLVNVYKGVKNLPELSAGVRSVFDRLINSEEEVAVVGNWLNSPLLAFDDVISGEDVKTIKEQYSKSLQAQEKAIKDQKIKEINTMRKTWQREGSLLAKDNARLNMIKNIIKEDGINTDDLLKGYDQETIRNLNQKYKGIATKKGLKTIGDLAEKYGFETEEAFIQDLINGVTEKDFINNYMQESENIYTDIIETEAPIDNEALAFFQLEADYLTKVVYGQEVKNVAWGNIKKTIDEKVGVTPVADLVREDVALKASFKRQAKVAAEAYKEGIKEGKITEKQVMTERLGKTLLKGAEKRLELATRLKAKSDARINVLKARAKYKRLIRQASVSQLETKTGGIEAGYKSQILALLESVGIKVGRQKSQVATKDFKSFLNEQANLGIIIYAPQWLKDGTLPTLTTGNRKMLGQLSYEEFTEFDDTINSLTYNGRYTQTLLANENFVGLETTAAAVANKINELKPLKEKSLAPENKILGAFGNIGSSLLKAEFIIKHLDGFEDFGPTYKALFAPIKKAEDNYINLTEHFNKAMKKGWGLFSSAEKAEMSTSSLREKATEKIGFLLPKTWKTTRHTFKGAPKPLTRSEMIAVYLNSGNLNNLKNLIEGNKFTAEGIKNVVENLSPKELNFANQIINNINELFEPLAEVHFKATGVVLPKVDPGEITAVTGETIKGWYYPIISDKEVHAQKQDIDDILSAQGYGKKTTRAGASHERTGAVVPVRLDLSVVADHINEVAYDITHRLAVRDVNKLLNQDKVIEAVVSRLGERIYGELTSWLSHVANPKGAPLKGHEQIIEGLRGNFTRAVLMLNLNPIIMQFAGFTQSADLLGSRYLAEGAVSFFKHPIKRAKEINRMSPSVRDRDKGYDRDIKEGLKAFDQNAGLLETAAAKVVKAGFLGIQFTDKLVVFVTWEGAYLKYMHEGKTHEQAVEYADLVVRKTQPLSSPKDTARVQRDGVLMKSITLFYTFYSGHLNRLVEQSAAYKAGKATVGDVVRTYMWTIVVPALLGTIYNREEIPTDKEGFKDFGAEILIQATAGVPLVRDLVNASLSGYSYKVTPLQTGIEASLSASKNIYEAAIGDEDFEATKTLRAAGFIAGLPTPQLIRTMRGYEALSEGETDNPLRLIKSEPRKD